MYCQSYNNEVGHYVVYCRAIRALISQLFRRELDKYSGINNLIPNIFSKKLITMLSAVPKSEMRQT